MNSAEMSTKLVREMGNATRQYLWSRAVEISRNDLLTTDEQAKWMRDVVINRLIDSLKYREDKWEVATLVGMTMAEEVGVDFAGEGTLDLVDVVVEHEGQQSNERGPVPGLTEGQKRIAAAIEECLAGALSS